MLILFLKETLRSFAVGNKTTTNIFFIKLEEGLFSKKIISYLAIARNKFERFFGQEDEKEKEEQMFFLQFLVFMVCSEVHFPANDLIFSSKTC